MPKFNRIFKGVFTNTRKPKSHHLVIKAQNGHLVVVRNGQPVPWPKDIQLIVKGRSTFTSMMKHLHKSSTPDQKLAKAAREQDEKQRV